MAKVAEMFRKPLMPWQEQVAYVGGEYAIEDGLIVPYYREIVITVPRQSGKTQLVLTFEIDRACNWRPRERILYTMQKGKDARNKLLTEQEPLLRSSPFASLLASTVRAKGEEAIVFKSGSRIEIESSSEEAGHGKSSIGLAVLDETWADADPRREQAAIPAMATRLDAQILNCSTRGTRASLYHNEKIRQCRALVEADSREGIAYFEWSADKDASDFDPTSPATWASCMPALGRTIDNRVVRHAFTSMKLDEFNRAYLNIPTDVNESLFPPSTWAAVNVADDAPQSRPYAIGIALHAETNRFHVVVCGTGRRGLPVCELVDGARLEDVVQMARKFDAPVVLAATAPEDQHEPKLLAAGVKVHALPPGDVANACDAFYRKVADQQVAVRRHPTLNAAVAVAQRRPLGDKWSYDRRGVEDVAPLVALTLAYWGATQIRRKPVFAY